MMIQDAEAELPIVRRARAYVAGHHADPIVLNDVARAMHLRPSYFCRIFKKATGLTFIDYLARTQGFVLASSGCISNLRMHSIGDVVGWFISAHTATIDNLERYITGDYPPCHRCKN